LSNRQSFYDLFTIDDLTIYFLVVISICLLSFYFEARSAGLSTFNFQFSIFNFQLAGFFQLSRFDIVK